MPRIHVTGNGRLTLGFDALFRLRDLYFPAAGLDNHTIGSIQDFGIRAHGRTEWIEKSWIKEIRSRSCGPEATLIPPNSGIEITVKTAVDPVDDVAVRRLRVKNLHPFPLTVTVYFHHDFHILESDLGNSVRWDRDLGGIVHWKRDRWFFIDARDHGETTWTIARRDDHGGRGARFEADRGELGKNPVAMGAGESIIAITTHLSGDGENTIDLRLIAADSYAGIERIANDPQSTPDSVIGRVEERHDEISSRAPAILKTLDPAAVELWTSSVLTLLSHQSRNGAIVAALDGDLLPTARDSYGYVWPRDAAFCAMALDDAGFHDRALSTLRLVAHWIEPEGFLLQRYHVDGNFGSTWHNVVDFRAEHLPIQEDETALCLWALSELARRHGADTIDRTLFSDFVVPAADFLDRYRNTETRLPKPSFDLWEERLGVHLFTVCAVQAALVGAARVADQKGRIDRAERWRRAADEIGRARETYLYHQDDARYARSAYVLDSGGYFLDMTPDSAAAGLFLFGDLGAPRDRTDRTLDDAARRLAVGRGGMARYAGDRYWRRAEIPGDVPGNPWILSALWAARARLLGFEVPHAPALETIIGWVLDRGRGSLCLAEQFDAETTEPLSVAPLVWSHAEWLTFVKFLADRGMGP